MINSKFLSQDFPHILIHVLKACGSLNVVGHIFMQADTFPPGQPFLFYFAFLSFFGFETLSFLDLFDEEVFFVCSPGLAHVAGGEDGHLPPLSFQHGGLILSSSGH